jgi:hypothetical protein
MQADKTLQYEAQDLLPSVFHRDYKDKHQIKIKGIIQFILARRPRNSTAWEFFPKATLDTFINGLQMECVQKGDNSRVALAYANLWQNVPILGFDAQYLEQMQNFRLLIEQFTHPLFEYMTFPKEALISKFATTMLLTEVHESLPLQGLARHLMAKNPILKGGVRVVKAKRFKPSDRDKNGRSMAKYRIVQLEGTQEFYDSLAPLAWNHRFKLGTDSVTIRSDGRRPPPTVSGWTPGGRGRGRGRGRGQRGTWANHAANHGNRRELNFTEQTFDKESMESINQGFGSFIFQQASQEAKKEGGGGNGGARKGGNTGAGRAVLRLLSVLVLDARGHLSSFHPPLPQNYYT